MFCWWVKPEHQGTYKLRKAPCPKPRFEPRTFSLRGNRAGGYYYIISVLHLEILRLDNILIKCADLIETHIQNGLYICLKTMLLKVR